MAAIGGQPDGAYAQHVPGMTPQLDGQNPFFFCFVSSWLLEARNPMSCVTSLQNLQRERKGRLSISERPLEVKSQRFSCQSGCWRPAIQRPASQVHNESEKHRLSLPQWRLELESLRFSRQSGCSGPEIQFPASRTFNGSEKCGLLMPE